ncbi:uncharacterized protein LOC131378759 isoform X1 [Hirundo rustica]|uniref:uncharacterized protein LOC131378759 isoform X1 n=1 Tax=Hirundo rustica TaxID=43150 RepID=UPI00267332AF|nr:uncharacterized protein LOC131378759 isoform X1 [Hirundo rustica]XP_058279924.1 uncharacterized protein LOC131378759 isoform X1 [Hirundo rustica]
MGGKLSAVQKGLYYSFNSVAELAQLKISKGELKRFVRWVFLHFPQTSPEQIYSSKFWQAVINKINNLALSGDKQASKFLNLASQLSAAVTKRNRKVQKQPDPRQPAPCSCSPALSPRPQKGVLKGAAGVLPAVSGPLRNPRSPRPGSPSQTAQGFLGSPGRAAREFHPSPFSPVNRPRVRFSLAEDSTPQNGVPSPYPQDGGDRMAQFSPSPYPPSFNPFLPALDQPNPFLSSTPPLPKKTLPMSPPSSRTPPSAPPSYSSHGNAHMTSSCSQTTPPVRRPASWASGSHAPPSGSHAPPSGSHDLGLEGEGPGPEPAEMHQPSPVPSVSPVVYKGSRGGHNVRAVHHPFSQATIGDLCKAHRDYGWDSPYFRGLLRSDLEAAVVIPADLRQLFSCLLDSTELKLWEAAWRQLLREALRPCRVSLPIQRLQLMKMGMPSPWNTSWVREGGRIRQTRSRASQSKPSW